ncbi:MAG: PEP-CTERM sorting domain-containing protein, partial [Deltaproteobacteria bacterium]|nr:PEP-CTERM sorting domain-containing protein [Deltaproteobacteria bacterium]
LGEDPKETYKDHPDFKNNDKARAGVSLFVYRVPEPGTGLLLVSGLFGLAAFGRRRSAA